MALRALSSKSNRSIRSFTYGSNPRFLSKLQPVPIFVSHLAHQLFDQFSKPPNARDAQVLRSLGGRINTETVEIVLKELHGWRAAHECFRWASWQEGFRHSCYTYNTMAEILCKAHKKAQLMALAREVVEKRCPMTPGALGFLIRCLGRQGLVDAAGYLFDNAKHLSCIPNSYTYNCFLEVLAKMGNIQLVETRFTEMVEVMGWEPDRYTLTAILQSYCNAGELDCVLTIFNKIKDKGWLDEHIFTILIISFSKWGKVDQAYDLVERMENFGMRLSEKTFHVLIHGFSKQGRVDRAVDLFGRMKGLCLNGDLPLFRVMIKGLCNGQELRRALDLYMEMKENGISPDILLVKELIHAACAKGDFNSVSFLLKEEGEKMDMDGLVTLYNAVLDGLVRRHEFERALVLLRAMMKPSVLHGSHLAHEEFVNCTFEVCGGTVFKVKEEARPNMESFAIVICGLCKFQKLDLALDLLGDMIAVGCKGNVVIYNDLISGLCKAERLEEGYKVLQTMKEVGFEPTEFTENSIFCALCKREDLTAVLVLLKKMRLKGHIPWIKHCTMMVEQLCKNGKLVEALDFLDGMVQVGFLPDIIAYSAAIDGLCKVGSVDKALKLFHDISSSCYSPDVVAYNILINGFSKAGRLNMAQEILDEMLEKGLVPSVVTYNMMIDGWCKANKMSEALTCFTKMVDDERIPNTTTYTCLIDGLCNVGAAEDAIFFWNEMKRKGCHPNKISYTSIIHGLCKCGRVDAALVYFREMKQSGFNLDSSVFLLLVNALILDGKTTKSFELLHEVLEKSCCPIIGSKDHRLMMKALSKLYESNSSG
ncbi:hypothetical protein HPP92_022482 [Vanilla planifolia]|uniref:Pentatricopeptide repeat-containing protein n=1 Tax=Vanilla planifolia TaxID=51239 RepID=A0A835PNM5_VANPL|nr:hypothetical protein HPP92_022482 [Vanilla planifolia]